MAGKIDFKGTDVKLWANDREDRSGGRFKSYSVSVGNKKDDGTWENMSIEARLTKNCPKDIPNGTEVNFEGFMSMRSYTNKDNKEVKVPVMVITSLVMPNGNDDDHYNDWQEAEDDIPF